MARAPDVVVVGAGIVGAACALALREAGLDVTLLDAATPGSGVTGAGMGHLVALDEHPAELDLCLLSLRLWREFLAQHPGVGDPLPCGTLWVAEDEHQLAEAHVRAARLGARGYAAELVDAAQLPLLEPGLRAGLCGGVRVTGDSVVYPPAVADFLARRLVAMGGTLLLGRQVVAVGEGCVTLADGATLQAGRIVLAAGVQAARLLPELPIFARKGHLAITDRYPGTLQHQVVSMNYGQAACGPDALAVAANVQPRATGQWLVGSCRQDHVDDPAIDPAVLAQVLRAAIALLPALGRMQVIRSWTGLRPATPDGQPLIGVHPGRRTVWLAGGHEGLGVTTAFGTAAVLAAQMTGRSIPIDAAPFAPVRFAQLTEVRHGH